VDGYERDQRELDVHAGWSAGLHDGWAHRWTTGLHYESKRFADSPLAPTPSILPADRVLSYPYIKYEAIQDDFSLTRNADQIDRTEDLFLGMRSGAQLGWSSAAFGADRSAAIVKTHVSRGLRITDDRHLLFASEFRGRLEGGDVSDAVLSTSTRYFWRTSPRTSFNAAILADAGHALDADHAILLGGDSGLRGYPLRYQTAPRAL
jgi:hypothetical protein